ncbi:MAG: hypothetical protein PHV45_07070 [Desulfuromonas thiophila]|nr:hypothetical protein [Desulfuromonas thiophila]
MDTFSHALWGLGLFGQRGRAGLALLFGALPDLISFAPFLLWRLVTGRWTPGKPPLEILPDWLLFNYALGHSTLVAGCAVLLLWCWRPELGFVACGWLFHIVLDFPFHSADYFPTQLLWPLSDFAFDGIPWSRPWIWYPNLVGVLALLVWRLGQRRRRRMTGKL